MASFNVDFSAGGVFNAQFEGNSQQNVEFSSLQIVNNGTIDHTRLINRDAAGQHPISAISGLDDELAEALTNEDIESILSGFTAF